MNKTMAMLLLGMLYAAHGYAQFGNTITIQGTGAPTGGAGQCSAIMRYVNLANGDSYSCDGTGTWVLTGSSSGLSGSGANTLVTFWTGTSTLGSDADFTFTGGNTLASPLGVFGTSLSTPLLISAGALGITPASGSSLSVNLATTGDFVVNTDDLVVDTSAGSVGVGIAAPTTNLDVRGANLAITAGGIVNIRTTNSQGTTIGGSVGFGDSGNTRAVIKMISVGGGSSGALQFATMTPGGTMTEGVRLTADQLMGIGTTAPTNILSLGGNSARTFWMERHTTANTAGNALSVQAGGATSGATDKNGGGLVLAAGVSTGTGVGTVTVNTYTGLVGAGTTDNTAVSTVFNGIGSVTHPAVLFGNLGTPSNGTVAYCSDCDPPAVAGTYNDCTSAGTETGAFAFRVNGKWKCLGD